ncbi:MAG TPA: DNA-directed RNA polymerase subunit beta [Enterococcus columbae]|nr:DNA-directed RNA polymerase subunit beta [Enterococcus columbae]
MKLSYTLQVVLKLVLVLVLAIILFFVGLMIGYGVIGNGKATDVFNPSIWQHIFAFFK